MAARMRAYNHDRRVPEIHTSQDYAEIAKSARLLTPAERARLAEAMTESLREAMPAEDAFAKARKIAGE
jgi:hypothetical protein